MVGEQKTHTPVVGDGGTVLGWEKKESAGFFIVIVGKVAGSGKKAKRGKKARQCDEQLGTG